jgi:uncharacterized protein (UPF0335 family)
MKLEMKKEEIEKLQEREKSLLSTFSSMIGENNKFDGFLTRVFKKKIKRAKKNDQSRDGSDDDSDDDDSDEEFSSSEESNSEEETLDDSICPPGCDQVSTAVISYSSFVIYPTHQAYTVWTHHLTTDIKDIILKYNKSWCRDIYFKTYF